MFSLTTAGVNRAGSVVFKLDYCCNTFCLYVKAHFTVISVCNS